MMMLMMIHSHDLSTPRRHKLVKVTYEAMEVVLCRKSGET